MLAEHKQHTGHFSELPYSVVPTIPVVTTLKQMQLVVRFIVNTAGKMLMQQFLGKNLSEMCELLNVTGYILYNSAWGVKCHF